MPLPPFRQQSLVFAACLTGAALFASCASMAPAASNPSPSDCPVKHIIVIYLENHSFDNLYGQFPGANGLANAGATARQVMRDGTPYATLPQPNNSNLRGRPADRRFPANLPNAPFPIDDYVPQNETTGDLIHAFYRQQLQINGGKMDMFVAWGDSAGLTMGYYNTGKLALYQLAREFTLADNFFTSAFGGSYLNHIWLIGAQTPRWPNPPADAVAHPDANGVYNEAMVTPDGYAVNTAYSAGGPHPANIAASHLLPAITTPNIGDRLSDKNIAWAWYAGGWDDALAGIPNEMYKANHQPFPYYAKYAVGTDGAREHLKDEKDFIAAIKSGTLPPVTFFKPIGDEDEHPGYGTVNDAEKHAADLVALIQASPVWKDCAIIITYDENGGFWDHVSPPTIDRWGPGPRIPTLIISPFAKRGFVDHSLMETVSILTFIEWRYGLAPLTDRDAKAGNMLSAFDFSRK